MGKAFEKQIKTIEDCRKTQIRSLKNLKDNKEKSNNNTDDYKNELLISKEKEIFRNIYHERLDKIEELTKKINCNDMNFIFNTTDSETDFSGAENPITILDNIKTNKKNNETSKSSQEDFNDYLKLVRRGKKAEKQSKTRKKAATQCEGSKILTPKSILQRLPKTLAQVKAGNNSESLLNEIKQIIYSLYHSK